MKKRKLILSFMLWLVACFVFVIFYKEPIFSIENNTEKIVNLTDTNINEVPEEIKNEEENLNDNLERNYFVHENLSPYEGEVEHVFFHPLIAYPEKAFDGDAGSEGMDNYMTTVKEAERFLEEVYKNDYILIDINKVYEKTQQQDGSYKMEKISFPFPQGKKPLVISLDDMNYYQYMQDDGCNYKIILDDKGEIATYSEDSNGNEVVSYDNEIITIVDRFVEKHPDFSFEGAKGAIGLTGYAGILGYRTQRDSLTRQEEIEKVKPIVAKLKYNGWIFASHSYGHYHMDTISNQKFKNDVDSWKNEVESIVGETRVFLYPYGEYIKNDNLGMEKINYLIDVGGFDIHAGVSVVPHVQVYSRYAFEVRKNIDGLTLRNQKQRVSHLFNADYVFDKESRGK